MATHEDLRIDGERLWQRLMEMARVGATPRGGCNRQALTDADREGRELFVSWCERAELDVRVDEIGNLFARRPGTAGDLPPVAAGSHLDTQPTGGRFDGVYGVLAALEVAETLNDHRLATRAPIEVVSWTNEEGARFPGGMTGSGVWSGVSTVEEARSMRALDPPALASGRQPTFGDELDRIGFAGPHPARATSLRAFFEIHIEQGPILERDKTTIGVVTGAQHMSRYDIRIEGQEAHAGTTPMEMRRDPVRAMARFLPRLYRLANETGPSSRLTFGLLHAEPGSSNTVPGLFTMTADIRHPMQTQHDRLVDGLREIVEEECGRLGLPVSVSRLWHAPGVEFAPECIDAVRQAAVLCGYSWKEMRSGAGHDAMNVSTVAPTGMIFIPCEGGLSHNEAENVDPRDAAAGANVLLHAILGMVKVAR